jgi:DNA-binding transcriptional regulator YdaS (Cro superfamily)
LPTLYIRTLKRAAELVGGEEPLARLLMVSPNHLALWIRGAASPPGDVFLRAAEIVTQHDLQQLSKPQPLPEGDAALPKSDAI